MEKFNAIAGLPRSGSTLLCNILNQREDVHVSSTSALPNILSTVANVMNNSPEVTSDLANDPDTKARGVKVLSGIVNNWYSHREESTIIDKSRAWGSNALLLNQVFPDAKIVVTVRDPRDVFASIEKQYRKTAEYGPQEKVWDRASSMFSETGLVGQPISWCEDLIQRKLKNTHFVEYDALALNPQKVMATVDKFLGLEDFEYDFDNVDNSSTDLDAQYRFRYPHEGSGKVTPQDGRWQDVYDEAIGAEIAKRWPTFFRVFGYS